MTIKIRRAAVLGAGVMGAQIAAHLAAAGVRVHLLDLPSDEPIKDPKLAKAIGKNVRNQRAILAMEQMKKLKPSPLMASNILEQIIPGNFEDDMSVIADADWVLEAVIERLDIKKSIHQQIATYARPHVPVSTNTSGIPLANILEGMSEEYAAQFFGTHFFNPPRYMHLLEMIPHGASNHHMIGELSTWIEKNLGKGIVIANDTVNFIGNRIGVFCIQAAISHMEPLGLNIETVDLLTGALMGRPSSGTFRTIDVVGLDTSMHVTKNVFEKVKNDPYLEFFEPNAWMLKLIENGALGQKTPKTGGCYLKSKDEKGKRLIKVYRPESGTYEPQQPKVAAWMQEAKKIPNLYDRLNFVFEQEGPEAEFVWKVLRDTISYSAMLLDEIADGEVKRVDDAVRWGFNFEQGPFELWQGLGYEKLLTRMQKEDVKLPSWAKAGVSFYSPAPNTAEWTVSGPEKQFVSQTNSHMVLKQKDFHFNLPTSANDKDPRVLRSNRSASVLDIGDGVAALVFHSKMNAIDLDIIEMIQHAIAITDSKFEGLIVANEGEAFSAGANLKYLLERIKSEDFDAIDSMLRSFQGSMQMLKYAPFPTVTCPHGLTLGGGCEVSFHADVIMPAGETYAGLVEVGVGLIPAGGGLKELAVRAYQDASMGTNADPMPFLQRAFMLAGMAQVSGSGFEALEKGIYPQTAEVVLSGQHQTLRAKQKVLHMIEQGYKRPHVQNAIKVVGDPGIQTFKMMLYNMLEGHQVSPYDAHLGEQIATVLCGGPVDSGTRVSEQYLLDLERTLFIELCKQEKTVERIEGMLKTGKPVRN